METGTQGMEHGSRHEAGGSDYPQHIAMRSLAGFRVTPLLCLKGVLGMGKITRNFFLSLLIAFSFFECVPVYAAPGSIPSGKVTNYFSCTLANIICNPGGLMPSADAACADLAKTSLLSIYITGVPTLVLSFNTDVVVQPPYGGWSTATRIGFCHLLTQPPLGAWPFYLFVKVDATCPVGYTYGRAYDTAGSIIFNGMCDPASQFTIALSGASEVEPSNGSTTNTLPFIATVIDQSTHQPPNHPVTVNISLKVDPTSGGHDHGDSSRPRGALSGTDCLSDSICFPGTTDGTGVVGFSFDAPEASGAHTITATCDGCGNTATAPVNVKVEGLSQIPASSFYALTEANGDVIGARPGWHTDNHNLTASAASQLELLAKLYHQKFPNDLVLHLNDASLPWGGVYDICARPGACTSGVHAWTEPHAEHRRGTVVDVRANGAAGSIPSRNAAYFIRLLRKSNMTYLHEDPQTSNEHYHVRLLGRSE